MTDSVRARLSVLFSALSNETQNCIVQALDQLLKALGNRTDWVRHGFITEFIDFPLTHIPFFYVADSCIALGIGLRTLAETLETEASA